MPTPHVPSEKQAEIEDLEQAIREAIDAEIGELAANLATTSAPTSSGSAPWLTRSPPRRSSSARREKT
jgi:hypothetical protein